MHKLMFSVIVFIYLNSFGMESQYKEFELAIINDNPDKAQQMLEAELIDPAVDLKGDILCITLALKNKNIPMARLLTKIIISKIKSRLPQGRTSLENPLTCAFADAGKNGDIETIHTLMSLEIPKFEIRNHKGQFFCNDIKSTGCGLAYGEGLRNQDSSFIRQLMDSYESYIQNPCSNAIFEGMILKFSEKDREVIDVVLSYKKGIDDLERKINSARLLAPECKEKYVKLLDEYKNKIKRKQKEHNHNAENIINSGHISEENKIEGIKELLKKGFDLNSNIGAGYTILHLAVLRKNPEVCRFLVDNGANPHIENCDNDTPYDIAKGHYASYIPGVFSLEQKSDNDIANILITSQCKVFRPGMNRKQHDEDDSLYALEKYNRRYKLNLELGDIFDDNN